jgi:hypothetical protein
VRDYLNTSVRNARVVTAVEGPIRAEYEASAVEDLYRLDLGFLPAVRYSVRISASYSIEYGSFTSYRELAINVKAVKAGVGAAYTATPTASAPQARPRLWQSRPSPYQPLLDMPQTTRWCMCWQLL